ncbi:3-oxoacyl-ACP reductase [Methylovirgula ligni]|uniref:NAD(P)-dependent dehydrogenase (Short-subunit alcohol dehydrogenase family) n=1 Tax=Methylovirgula ligni TaxID=569860 RepID=A0A3D9Z6K8_9HYPH|nr:SDR family oxidoreductase [Methylovirgula ligni]QAY95497.1 3-oxoacyl-ACP reductase [Methylovirgula ligni]REF89169.1 NAD(P)-dependent dehydrogenase (short-subunit alcohol dehydrogenase family) [Methylovirgula ligni]
MAGNGVRLAGRKLLITGGGSGIGAATCHLFAAEGARVAVLDQNGDAANTIAEEVNGIPITVDVRDEANVTSGVQAAAKALQGLDGVVNVAGISIAKPFEDTDPALWALALSVNLTGPYLVCRAALPFLLESGNATIVNIATGAALQPLPNRSAYAASKGGLIAFSKVLAVELAPKVRVNVVCPGGVDTPFVRNEFKTEEAITRITSRYALRRLAKAEEIAAAILFLTSDESSYVTGSTLSVDGGRTFH